MSTIHPDAVGESTVSQNGREVVAQLEGELAQAGVMCLQRSHMVPLTTHGLCVQCATCPACSLRRIEPGRDLCEVCAFAARVAARAGAPVKASIYQVDFAQAEAMTIMEKVGPRPMACEHGRPCCDECWAKCLGLPSPSEALDQISGLPHVAKGDMLARLEAMTGVSAEDFRKAEAQRRALNKAAIQAQREAWATGQSVEPEQLDLPIAESGIADLIRDRAALWMRRSDKWHNILNRERAWTWRGVALPGVVGALCALAVVLDALKVLHVPVAAAWPAVGAVIIALISLRANAARVQLDAGKAGEAWVVADRMAEHYRGLVAELATVEGSDDLENTRLLSIFRESQKLEGAARFGLPDTFAEVLREMT